MKRFSLLNLILATCILLSACASQRIGYFPKDIQTTSIAVETIEQVFYEQPLKHRPEGLVVTESYLGLTLGAISESKGVGFATGLGENMVIGIGNTKTLVTNLKERMYFNSMGTALLYKQRGWYIVQIVWKDGRLFRNVYTREKNKAEALIDALAFFSTRHTSL